MIKAVIFDVDGVIIKSETIFSQNLSKDFNVPNEKILPFFKNEFQNCIIGKADLKEEVKKYLSDWNWSKTIDELLLYWFEHENNVDQKIIDSVNTLQKNGIRCFIATNNEKYRTEYLASTLELSTYFTKIFSSSSLGAKKPQREFWQLVFEQLPDLQKEEILVVDDDKENIASAQEFGFETHLYTDYDTYAKRNSSLILPEN